MAERLYRSPYDRVIAGVAGGLAVWLNIDASLVRIAWVLLAIFSGGLFVLVYLVMMIVVPLPPAGWVPRPRDAGPAGPGGIPGWQPGGPGTWGAQQGGTPAPGWAPGSGQAPDPTAPGGWSPPPQGQSTPPQGWSGPVTPGNAGLVAGVVLVLLGAWFLVDEFLRIDWNLVWPVVVIVVGGLLIAGALRRGR